MYRWMWQSAKYETTPFQLHQLLTSPDPLTSEVKVTSRKLTTYNKTYKFDLGGKIGGKLKALLDVEISGRFLDSFIRIFKHFFAFLKCKCKLGRVPRI